MPIEENKAVYRRYLARCNAHDFESLGEFVTENVVVNGQPRGLADYQAELARIITAFPNYHWELSHLLAEGDWLAAHFIDTGTHHGVFLGVNAKRDREGYRDVRVRFLSSNRRQDRRGMGYS